MERNRIRYIIYLSISGVFGFLVSCGSIDQVGVSDYLNWIQAESNGLKVIKELNDYRFELQYKPVEFVALNEQRTIEVDLNQFEKRMKELGDMQYYTLKIESLKSADLLRSNTSTQIEYNLRLQYFSDLAQHDIKLIDGIDTLSCQLYHFERNYGLAPYNNVVLGFSNPNKGREDKILSFNEQVFGLGKINLSIDKNDINNIPELILN